MTAARWVASGVLLVVAVLVQGSLVARLAVPLRPDLVVLGVATLGLAGGPEAGAAAGFGAGLLADSLADHPAGAVALVLTGVGYACGLAAGRGLIVRLAVVAGATAASVLGVAAVLAGIGGRAPDWPALGASLPGPVAGSAILAVLVVPALGAARHRR